jgi:hypothetical protein
MVTLHGRFFAEPGPVIHYTPTDPTTDEFILPWEMAVTRTTARPQLSDNRRAPPAIYGGDSWRGGDGPRPVPAMLNPVEWPRLGLETTCNVAAFSAMACLIWFGYLTGGRR